MSYTTDAPTGTLSYDDSVAYEDLPPGPAFASRIGRSKVYLLDETLSLPHTGKRKLDAEAVHGEEDVEMTDSDPSLRRNALFMQGKPICSLSTEVLLSYAVQYAVTRPLGIEWVDDESCVFVFETREDARAAQRHLQKVTSEEPDADGFTTAKPIPVALWPAEERINRSLGKSTSVHGILRIRWAKAEDVKKRGAKQQSEFYRKQRAAAVVPASKRQRTEVDAEARARLDDDIDAYLAASDNEEPEEEVPTPPPPPPPSRMRADWLDQPKSLLERTSARPIASLPRRPVTDAYAPGRVYPEDRPHPEENRGLRGRRQRPEVNRRMAAAPDTRRVERPRVSQQDLDDELDAFLNARE